MLPAPFFTAQGVIHAGLTLKRVRARMMPTLFSKFVASAQVELDDVAELLHSGRRLCLQENSVKDQTWPKEDIKISTYLNNQKKCIQHTYRPHISNWNEAGAPLHSMLRAAGKLCRDRSMRPSTTRYPKVLTKWLYFLDSYGTSSLLIC